MISSSLPLCVFSISLEYLSNQSLYPFLCQKRTPVFKIKVTNPKAVIPGKIIGLFNETWNIDGCYGKEYRNKTI